MRKFRAFRTSIELKSNIWHNSDFERLGSESELSRLLESRARLESFAIVWPDEVEVAGSTPTDGILQDHRTRKRITRYKFTHIDAA